jgi:hypothetical protein
MKFIASVDHQSRHCSSLVRLVPFVCSAQPLHARPLWRPCRFSLVPPSLHSLPMSSSAAAAPSTAAGSSLPDAYARSMQGLPRARQDGATAPCRMCAPRLANTPAPVRPVGHRPCSGCGDYIDAYVSLNSEGRGFHYCGGSFEPVFLEPTAVGSGAAAPRK